MFSGYGELSKLPPEAFLDWKQFATENDSLPAQGYSQEQYQKGLEQGRQAKEIHISVSSVWSSVNQDGSATFSSEGIGYHSCTDQLLRGFLDSGCAIIVHRWNGSGMTETRIK